MFRYKIRPLIARDSEVSSAIDHIQESLVRSDSTICDRCHSVLEQDCSRRCAGRSRTFTRDTIDWGCRFCRRFCHWMSSSEPSTFSICFLDSEVHSTYRPSPATNLTECYLKVQRPDRRTDDRPYSNIFVHLIEPVHKKDLRKDFPPSRELRPLLAGHTRSPLVLHVLRNWIDNCVKNHKTCNSSIARASKRKDSLPTRLIAVDKKGQLRLVEPQRNLHPVHYCYATLTHRWGKHQTIQLSQKNKQQMKSRIRLLGLPPVFRDAIRVCQSIGIPYLWIDTLCIIQDDDSDRSREVMNMGDIFENAFLNIGGLSAADTVINNHTEGLFVDRHLFAAENDPICVRIRRTDYDELSYVFVPGGQQHLVDVDIYKAPLMRRGWVLQERLLSRRSVYFGSQLYWECGELQACEYFPDGDNITNLAQAVPLQWGSGASFRMSTLARIIHRVNHEPVPLIRWESNYQCWMTVVERFSTCGLTVESDRLPALSGLAKKFACIFKDEYLAGLWKNDLIREMLWYSSFRSGVQFDSREYRAPTWSWASKTFPVNFLFNSRGRYFCRFIITAKILESKTDLKGKDVTGEVCGGSLCLRGPMVETQRNTILWPQKTWSGHMYEWYDEGYDTDGYRPVGDTYHFLIGHTPPGLNDPWAPQYDFMKVGLILKPVEGKDGTYKRIGMFTHTMPNIVPVLPYVKFPLPGPGECTEFFDFDVDKYECKTVLIM